MKRQPGFISTQLHQGIASSTVPMNFAARESVAYFRAAFNHPDFKQSGAVSFIHTRLSASFQPSLGCEPLRRPAGLTVVLSHSGWSLAMSHTKAEKTFTELILEIFQFNGRLLAAGDRRAKRLGLTSYAGRCSARSRNAPAGGPDRLQHATGAAKRTAAHGRTAGRGIRRVHPGS
jgi:hypothetical protein